MRRWLTPILILTLLVAGAFWAVRVYRQPGLLPARTAFMVPRGSLARVGEALAQAGVVGDPLAFRVAALVTRGQGPVRAAEFSFPAHASLAAVLIVLRTGHPVEHAITVAEGLSAAEIARLLSAADALTGPLAVPPEGGVLPQTYDYERGTARDALLSRMRSAMRDALAEAWRTRAPSLTLRSPAELLVLASMIERETGLPSERALIAGVFIHRLRVGMRLQSDPTTAYEAGGGLELARRLTRADLAAPNPYNTYVAAGLPPAPICSPGAASLEAAAHPADTGALYFVADGTGGHAFAATLEAQARNVARYRALTDPRDAGRSTAPGNL